MPSHASAQAALTRGSIAWKPPSATTRRYEKRRRRLARSISRKPGRGWARQPERRRRRRAWRRAPTRRAGGSPAGRRRRPARGRATRGRRRSGGQALGAEARVVGRAVGHLGPGPGQERRLDRRRAAVGAPDQVVGEGARQAHAPAPEDRVADVAVRPLGRDQRPQLAPRPGGVDVAPGDGVQARVPEELVRELGPVGAGVAVLHAVRRAPLAPSWRAAAGRPRRAAARRLPRCWGPRPRAPA